MKKRRRALRLNVSLRQPCPYCGSTDYGWIINDVFGARCSRCSSTLHPFRTGK